MYKNNKDREFSISYSNDGKKSCLSCRYDTREEKSQEGACFMCIDCSEHEFKKNAWIEIEEIATPYYLNIKRFYPPFEIEWRCPECHALNHRSSDHYLMYPSLNEDFELWLGCHECEHEESIILRMELKTILINNT